jgi:hypothetical protein
MKTPFFLFALLSALCATGETLSHMRASPWILDAPLDLVGMNMYETRYSRK